MPNPEWLAIGIWELMQDANHNPRHMALAQELARLYRAAGEPVTSLLDGVTPGARAATDLVCTTDVAWYATSTTLVATVPLTEGGANSVSDS